MKYLAVCLALIPLPAIADLTPAEQSALKLCLTPDLTPDSRLSALVSAGWAYLTVPERTMGVVLMAPGMAIRQPAEGIADLAVNYTTAMTDGMTAAMTDTGHDSAWLAAGPPDALSYLWMTSADGATWCNIAAIGAVTADELTLATTFTTNPVSVFAGTHYLFRDPATGTGPLHLLIPDPAGFAQMQVTDMRHLLRVGAVFAPVAN